MLQYHQFEFIGLKRFGPIQEKLYTLLEQAMTYRDDAYNQAIEEAVCNAARYALDGPRKAHITIVVQIMPSTISIQVLSKTHPFDAKAYQKRLQALLKDPVIRTMDWGDYVGLSDASTGFWYMLTGCDYLYLDSHGQAVTLVTSIRDHVDVVPVTRIGALVPRFLVRENGVIL